MMYRFLTVACSALALGLLLSLPASLPAEETEANAEPPWYEFEVLVFRRIDKGAGSTEAWPNDPGAPSFENAISFDTRGSATLRGDLPIPYRPLPKAQRRLGNIWTAFRNSRNYRPLYHVAWRQQVVDPEQAQSLYLYLPPDSGEPSDYNPPKLEGTLKFGVKRYLHMETDLLLRLPVTPAEGDDYFMGPAIRSYRLHTTRRMRSGKLHYLDHPVLGVLVQAERYEPPVPEPELEPEVMETTPPTEPPGSSEAAQPTQPEPATNQQ
ncbi:MAG: CsiV family protein [Candidatus Thiodiazotropha sp.]